MRRRLILSQAKRTLRDETASPEDKLQARETIHAMLTASYRNRPVYSLQLEAARTLLDPDYDE